MTYTPPTRSTHSRSATHRASADRQIDPPRKQAEAKSAKDKFASKLDKEGNAAGSERKGGVTATDNSNLFGPFANNRSLESDHGSGGFEGFAQSSLMIATGATANAGGAASGVNSIDTATLQRMAAQIAESWPSRVGESLTVQFGEGALAQSALVSREPDGSIAIRIAGLDPNLTARQNARAQLELANALAQKRLRVASLKFEEAATDQRSLPSAMPRAV